MLFNRDSAIQKCFRRFCIICKSVISVPCQPSGRRVIPSGRSSVHSPSRLDDMPYRPDARQTKYHSSKRRGFPSGPSSASRSFCSSLHLSRRLSSPSGRLSMIELQIFFPKSNMGRLLQPSGRRGFSSGRTTP
jgi:hypothetical protein